MGGEFVSKWKTIKNNVQTENGLVWFVKNSLDQTFLTVANAVNEEGI